MKKPKSKTVPRTSLKKTQASIPVSREELFRLHDIAAGLQLLRDIAKEAPEMQLIQAELLIKKTSQCAWNLIHEELDSRWQECHPDVDLIQKA
jgi:hypothetical protein